MTHPGNIILTRAIPDEMTRNKVILDLCDTLRLGDISLRDARLAITMETTLGLTDEQIAHIVAFAKTLCQS